MLASRGFERTAKSLPRSEIRSSAVGFHHGSMWIVAWNNVSIVEPLFTLPLLGLLHQAAVATREPQPFLEN